MDRRGERGVGRMKLRGVTIKEEEGQGDGRGGDTYGLMQPCKGRTQAESTNNMGSQASGGKGR